MVVSNEDRAAALDSLVDERAQALADERAAEEKAEQDAANRILVLKGLVKQCNQSLKTRKVLVPQLLQALIDVTAVAESLKRSRDAYKASVMTAMKMGENLPVTYPKPFGLASEERDILRAALATLSDIGGRV